MIIGWEIEQVTTTLAEELACADVLLGISEFNSEVFRRTCPDTPVVTVSICPPLPDSAEPDRPRWSIPKDVTVFLSVFDPVSGFDRKNPLDVLTAFTDAFLDRDDVRLVFKVHGGFAKNPDEGDLTGEERRASEFLKRCRADRRVILIDEYLSYPDTLRLIASCDGYISLARAEGLGLPVLEAMALGVPTVCTGYAGHLDFVRPDSNLLVPYELIDIPESASHYYHPRNFETAPQWAQPDVAVAAAHLRALADDASLRTRLSVAGKDAASSYQERARVAEWVQDLADALASPSVHANHPLRQRRFALLARREAKIWGAHARQVRRARLALSIRTRLGAWKRRVVNLPPHP